VPDTAPKSYSSRTLRRPGRLLIVDDEPFLGEALYRAFRHEHEVMVLTEASAALSRLLNGERFDIILCDLMMPAMDGIEFHRRVAKALPDEANRIVFITGGAITARVEAFFNRVSNTLLEKPIDIDGLKALIDRRVSGAAGGGSVLSA
jgi:CheY-like chemotaxis protein